MYRYIFVISKTIQSYFPELWTDHIKEVFYLFINPEILHPII